MSYKLRETRYGLRVTRDEGGITILDLRFPICDLRFAFYAFLNSPRLCIRITNRGLRFSHPHRLLRRDLFEDRAVFLVRAGQVAGRHEEFFDDLAAGEDEGFLEDLNTITTVRR